MTFRSGASPAPGAIVGGRFKLDRPLGKGGMGEVWAARHEVTRKYVALKFLRTVTTADADVRRRFAREARAASAVDHPNVISVQDFFEADDGTLVMVMDLLEGETLRAMLAREHRLSLPAAAEILLPVVSAVGAAHARGIVHRDLKPENVFLAARPHGPPHVWVLDFGVAKITGSDGVSDLSLITSPGSVVGTLAYMSPEQAFGDPRIDHRTDVWALGVMLYELLAGERPFEGEPARLIRRIVTGEVRALGELAPALPEEVKAFVMRCLSVPVDQRPHDLRSCFALLSQYSPARVPPVPAAARAESISDAPPTPDPAAGAIPSPSPPLSPPPEPSGERTAVSPGQAVAAVPQAPGPVNPQPVVLAGDVRVVVVGPAPHRAPAPAPRLAPVSAPAWAALRRAIVPLALVLAAVLLTGLDLWMLRQGGERGHLGQLPLQWLAWGAGGLGMVLLALGFLRR